MEEITGAIISITLVMGAVFIPVTFITGPTGVFYEQFGVTLMLAIAISAVNALTLSPALCALLLKPHTEDQGKKPGLAKRFFNGFNTAFEITTTRYVGALKFLYRFKWITGVIILGSVGVIVWAAENTPTGFVPEEDRGLIFTDIVLPEGASLDRTVAVTDELMQSIENLPGVEGGSMVNGFSLISGEGSNFGLGFIRLKPWEERGADSLSARALIGKMFGIAAGIPGAKILFFAPPSIPGFGVSSGFELKFLDQSGGSFNELDIEVKKYMGKLMERPEILYAQTAFSTGYPQYEMVLNIPKAKEAGVSVSSILGTLQGYIGSIYAADFSKFGKQYRVYVQALPQDRAEVDDLNSLFVRNNQGEMAPISEFLSLKRVYGPQAVTRFNLFNSVAINGAAAPGYSTGDAIKAIQEVNATELPRNFAVDYSGLTREEINASSQTTFIILLSILCVLYFSSPI